MKVEGVVGFLGFGNMGGAILRGLLGAGTLAPANALVYDMDAAKNAAAGALGAGVAKSAQDLAARSDTLLLAPKPQDMEQALNQVKPGFSTRTRVISIAAGISTRYIQDRLGAGTRVVRVMPNTPALVGAGAAGIALSRNCSGEDAEIAKTIFGAIGIAAIVPEEAMDTVTALSGSGPAYFFYMVECLVKAAVAQGLTEEVATQLATQTLLGAGRLLSESGEPAHVLREKVTSKGGTTAAALARFREERFEEVVRAGVDAAAARSKELGK